MKGIETVIKFIPLTDHYFLPLSTGKPELHGLEKEIMCIWDNVHLYT